MLKKGIHHLKKPGGESEIRATRVQNVVKKKTKLQPSSVEAFLVGVSEMKVELLTIFYHNAIIIKKTKGGRRYIAGVY